jgi:uncharacterized repeat protein (TIGR01451 family)
MNRASLVFLALSLLGAPFALTAQTPESPLASSLAVFVVETTEDGAEALASRETINPGEVIEYQLTYENVSERPLRQIRAVGQIPAETAFIEGSPVPAGTYPIEYSLDGVEFAAPPLTYEKVNEDGSTEEAVATPSMYRALRWTIPELAVGEKEVLHYRVTVR